jgi:DNA-directed RNA polymerase subunit RPC12/RpoP
MRLQCDECGKRVDLAPKESFRRPEGGIKHMYHCPGCGMRCIGITHDECVYMSEIIEGLTRG